MTDALRTYVLAVADGEGPPSDRQWEKIVDLARSGSAPATRAIATGQKRGAALREAREAKGLSQAALAEVVGTTQQTIDRIERGEIGYSRYLAPALEAVGLAAPHPAEERLRYAQWLATELTAPGRSQSGLARHMGLDQSAVNRMALGNRAVKVEELPLIESYLAETAQN